jgi:hypothetical protein
MRPNPTAIQDSLPESVASRVLERAAHIDSVAPRTTTLVDMRAAAAADGITEAALNQALAEVLAGPVGTPAGEGYTGKVPWALTMFVAAAALILVVAAASAVLLRVAGGA